MFRRFPRIHRIGVSADNWYTRFHNRVRDNAFLQNRGVRTTFILLSWAPVIIFFGRNVAGLSQVTGTSMQPTFNPDLHNNPLKKDTVLLDKMSIRRGHVRRGDVVTLWSPEKPRQLTVKRVIALEGDTVYPLPPSPPRPVRIERGHCWVEGDSHHRTIDSNTYGQVPLGLLDGRVLCIVVPYDRTSIVPNGLGKSAGRVKRMGEEYRLGK